MFGCVLKCVPCLSHFNSGCHRQPMSPQRIRFKGPAHWVMGHQAIQPGCTAAACPVSQADPDTDTQSCYVPCQAHMVPFDEGPLPGVFLLHFEAAKPVQNSNCVSIFTCSAAAFAAAPPPPPLDKTPILIQIKHSLFTFGDQRSPALTSLEIAIVGCSRLPPSAAALGPLFRLMQPK